MTATVTATIGSKDVSGAKAFGVEKANLGFKACTYLGFIFGSGVGGAGSFTELQCSLAP